MCNVLMSVTDDSLVRKIEKDCIDVDKSMLAFPVKIPGTRYYKGIKVRQTARKRVHRICGSGLVLRQTRPEKRARSYGMMMK